MFLFEKYYDILRCSLVAKTQLKTKNPKIVGFLTINVINLYLCNKDLNIEVYPTEVCPCSFLRFTVNILALIILYTKKYFYIMLYQTATELNANK